MTLPIVQTLEPITLIGGGHLGPDDCNLALKHAPTLVAADGGAHAALAEGHIPQAVIGDFDSISASVRNRIPPERLFPIPEQDSTDFDKALRHLSTPLLLGVGFMGRRVDHQLAVFNALIRRAERAVVLISEREVIFHAPPKLTLDIAPGAVVSIFPLAKTRARSRGLEWPIDAVPFAPDGAIGTSNRTPTGRVEIEVDAPGLLIFLPREALVPVMQGLQASESGRWPAREE
ncbi:thiamine diphosphokinase [Phaeobacter gallaeciensis]|uniref:Thiamine diphosphokinase n=2 Tax=Roseobacteraceae TaxID=2854170 RepID=A0A366X3G3_9RHOB|nr:MULTISPECIES: thiamine diphosphokinase [Roseobacteraceae]MBT3143573.1 thiamine diphosphokinase [Falsiruegeria litorea]MBT8167843.1 thiamine diphosphokinase [Falsiruegeria litorea]RBW55489.1 thiamine diphosphokinase [Phaeobacter gallaeciensis]